ncbi:MAG: DNA repair protein RecN [Pseudomonadota bacterium]
MLTGLHIKDYVLIDQAELALARGLTALTGETGAGKSILLDALGLAVGGRAERGAVRAGASQGVIAASFEPDSNHAAWALLEENGLDAGEAQIILRRVQGADGRSRGFINDQPVSIALLRTIGESLLEIHGQHDGRGFLAAATHRDMVDEFGGLTKDARAVAASWKEWREIENDLEERWRERDATAREADYLRHVATRLEELAPEPGEESALAARRAELMAAEKINDDLAAAASAVDEGGVEGKLSVALRNIERARARLSEGGDVLSEAASRLDAALNEAGEARIAIERAIEAFGADPAELEASEERLFALRGEARKHGLQPDDLATFLAKTQKALSDLETGEAAFSHLEKALAAARETYEKAAARLSKGRVAAGKKLDAAVAAELAPLKLGKARFVTSIEPDPDHPGSDGWDKVEFMVATNPGAPAGPLKSIASGGELSRFVLAMKAALAAKENRTVIIFDEVDAGVGGAVADAVGERLARLATDAQVLVVTHSPQVAARAHAHWRIEKRQNKASTSTRVTPLDAEARIEEIARMLSGAKVTDEARAAAQRLLGGPGKTKATKRKLAKTG